jgi:iron complex outermembrane receptor protein
VQSQDELTLTESRCRLGELDIHSPTCVAALRYVTRSAGDIVSVYVPKINLANDLVNAFVAQGNYRLNLGARGTLEFQASWNDILTHTDRVYPGDPTTNLLTATDSFVGFKSRIDASVTWAVRGWHNTIYVNRVGSQPNHAATFGGPPYRSDAGSLHPWTITNLTTRYQWSRALELSVSIQNAFDVMPPPDHTWGGKETSPYSAGAYDVNGRSYYAQLTYQLAR